MGAFLIPEVGENMSDYPDFIESTGYSDVAGLCGANCRHSFMPFYPGITRRKWTDEELQKYKEKTYTFTGADGKPKTVDAYEASQILRGMERNVRAYKKRVAVKKATGTDTYADEKMLKYWQDRIVKYTDETGLRRQSFRERIAK